MIKVIDRMSQVVEAVAMLSSTRVMVGVPAEEAPRDDADSSTTINNAALAYIHDNGAPEANIPPRPFMGPGIEEAKEAIVSGLAKAGKLAFEGKGEAVDRQFHRVGMIARDSIKRKVTTGPFTALKPRTIEARRRRSTGSNYRRKAVKASDTRPLIDTGAMRNAINYVLRKARDRR